MTEIRAACQNCQAKESAVKRLLQGSNRMTRISFEPRSCQSQTRGSNRLATCRNYRFIWQSEEDYSLLHYNEPNTIGSVINKPRILQNVENNQKKSNNFFMIFPLVTNYHRIAQQTRVESDIKQ